MYLDSMLTPEALKVIHDSFEKNYYVGYFPLLFVLLMFRLLPILNFCMFYRLMLPLVVDYKLEVYLFGGFMEDLYIY